MVYPSTFLPDSIGATTVTQLCIMESTNTLKNLGDKGPPWVNPRYSLKEGHKYPPAFATIQNQVQYVCKIRSVRGLTPYPVNMLRHRSQSRAL